MQPDLRRSMEAELVNAERARLAGNEGRARVCARRAAGMAARDYLSRRSLVPHSGSAFDTLKLLAQQPDLPQNLLTAAERLTLVVDEDFHLPAGIDLIDEAKKLIGGLE